MQKSDIKRIDAVLALVLLTRLPLPHLPKDSFARQSRAVWAFPLAGLVVGGLASVMAMAALAVWPPAVAAGLALAVQILVTGAMHEDGLADSADGLWGGFDRSRRLEIMKDSQIGTYGVLVLVLSLGLRWLTLSALLAAGMIWAPVALAVLSRATMPVLMASLPNARGSGLSQSVGRPTWGAVLLGGALALLLGLLSLGAPMLLAALVLIPVVAGMRALARAKIGGQTGDILGATQQISEIAAGLTLLALL
ncbi:adenosylcobinamide-GDP ribazoletransferase [Epibacterium sp. MM17-32]|uniref:adenosylcobinamide-GDP ribazoletransferase n=1 Tax=Epibacterium sp. MM17-32 TaxID=2917734 RepID=UPI001EF69669|nr:adenosylcobinamide-GDP ribazoletransferase [Epibacterium sp. MM17-32]MCG7627781.1 adenosylcobinamide-GDP ribazoletransferase [Epibacterium sp. MM17-32]